VTNSSQREIPLRQLTEALHRVAIAEDILATIGMMEIPRDGFAKALGEIDEPYRLPRCLRQSEMVQPLMRLK
jgi:hypothetical protein